MSVTQYIGSRYVPLFADPLAWDITQQYEPLTIVYYQGNSYTSRQAVPAGIDITNTDYWALTGNYNAQIEQYRAEVQTYDDRITANTSGNATQDAQLAGTTSSGLKTLIDANKTLIDANTTANTAQDAQLAGTSSSGLKTLIDANAGDIDALETKTSILSANDGLVIIGDSWSSNNSGAMPGYIAKALNCTLHSYAHGSQGFVQGEDNFLSQAQRAAADTTYDHDSVKYVVIIGGTNDFSHGITSGSTLSSAIVNIASVLRESFKKAAIHVFFNYRFSLNNGRLSKQLATWNSTARALAISNAGVIAHPETICWLNSSYFGDDLVHLTANGYYLWAQYVALAVTGGNTSKYTTGYTAQQLDGAEGFSGNACMFFDEHEMWVNIYLIVNEDSTSVTTVKNGATGLWPVMVQNTETVQAQSNKLGVPLCKTDGRGMGSAILHFHMNSDGRDSIQVAPLSGGTLTAGHYTGYARTRFYGA